MHERPRLTPIQINRDLLRSVFETPLIFYVLLLLLLGLVGLGVIAATLLVTYGLGVTGLNHPVFWGFFIINFVFWVGISHAGTMISAILRLTSAEWRRPVVRAAEVMTVFSLMTAALFVVLHTGRPWRTLYWAFPYDFVRGIWPDVRSPLVWDPSAIFTYLTGSILFVYAALIPDLALARDKTTGWRRMLYGLLCLGWRGNARQWKLLNATGLLLSALILPVFVSVHSIVSWDFGMSLVPGWHVHIFAPYFVVGAVLSGVAAVIALMAVMRSLFRLHDYIRPEHFDMIGRLLIVVALAWAYFYFMDVVFALLSKEEAEYQVMKLRLSPPYLYLFLLMITCNFFLPVPIWMFRRFRRNIGIMVLTAIVVNIGMWLERFLIIVPTLQRRHPDAFAWGNYSASLVEITLVIFSFANVCLLLLLFSKIFPVIPIWEEKEGHIWKREFRIGKLRLPAIVRE